MRTLSGRWHGVRIVKSKRFRKCRDGTVMNEFLLDEEIPAGFLEYLGRFGEVKILNHLDPPFYSCTRDGCFTIKGMLGDHNIHVKFDRDSLEPSKILFHELLAGYPGKPP